MDADRYRKVQRLFWEAEELPPEQWAAFLQSAAGDDPDVIHEVQSLLKEHDPDAAQSEGNLTRRRILPVDSIRSDASTGFETAVIADRLPAGSRRRGAETVASAQRTHAMPRHAQQRPRPAARAKNPVSGVARSQTLTSIGPARKRGTRCRVWLAMTLPMVVSIWIAAAFAGQREDFREALNRNSRLLAIAEHLSGRVTDVLEQWRRAAIALRDSTEFRQAVRDRIQSPNQNELESSDRLRRLLAEQLAVASGHASFQTESIQFSIWNEAQSLVELHSSLPSVNQSLIGRDVAPDGAAALARARRGRLHLFGPALPSDLFGEKSGLNEQPVVGWMFPVSGDGTSKSDAFAMLGQQDLFNQINEIFDTAIQIHQVDAYLVNSDGIMLTTSSAATKYAGGPVSGQFRVSEPSATGDTQYSITPLTIAASAVQVSRQAETPDEWYLNYAGQPSWGGWLWLESYSLGVIVEQPAAGRVGLLSWLQPWQTSWPWATLLSLAIAGISAWVSSKLDILEPKSSETRRPLGHYEIREVLGTGGMGEVYRAHHMELGRDIAIKILRSDRQDDDDRQRFDREARMAAALTSPHSVTIYDYGRDSNGDLFCAMQLLKGLTLYEVVTRSGPQPTGRVVQILRQICQSIHEAHSMGLMHRDLKPQNVMLHFDSLEGDWAVVFDFGLAKPLQPDPDLFQTAETIWAGTPMYMSPERFREPSVMDPRSDIYSIGCIAYFLLAGHPPFSECDPQSMFALILSESPISLSIHRGGPIESELESLVARCMAKDKDTRYASIIPLMDDLDQLTRRCTWSRQQARDWWQTHAPEAL